MLLTSLLFYFDYPDVKSYLRSVVSSFYMGVWDYMGRVFSKHLRIGARLLALFK